eukprot:COSAG05_NODE_12937_length_448_cov_0.902579_1_plen_87_part_00
MFVRLRMTNVVSSRQLQEILRQIHKMKHRALLGTGPDKRIHPRLKKVFYDTKQYKGLMSTSFTPSTDGCMGEGVEVALPTFNGPTG